MRFSVIAPLGVAALALGIGLVRDRLGDVQPPLESTPVDVAPVSMQDDAPAVAVSLRHTAPLDTIAASANGVAAPAADPADPTFGNIYLEPAFRAVLVRQLVDRGLAAQDAERIVDATIAGLSACAAASSAYDPRDPAGSVCSQNVLQRAGLDDASFRGAIVAAGSSRSRRLALESARGFEIGVAMSFRERMNAPPSKRTD